MPKLVIPFEDRISKKVWFENITLRDRQLELQRLKKKQNTFSSNYIEPIKPSFWHPFPRMQEGTI